MADGLSLPSPLSLLQYIERDQPDRMELERLAISKQNLALSEARYRLDVLGEMRRQREFELNERRQTVFSTMKLLTEGYQNSKSATMRQHYLNSMRRYGKFLSPLEQEGFMPFLQAGPLSPMAERENEFMLQYGNGPTFSDERRKLYKDNPLLATQDAFSVLDFQRFRDKFISGIDRPKQKFISLGDGIFGIRGDDDVPKIATSQDLMLNDLAKKYGKSVAEIEASGGIINVPGSEITTILGGVERRYVNTLDIVSKKTGTKLVYESNVPTSPEVLPGALTSFMENWALANDDEEEKDAASRERKRLYDIKQDIYDDLNKDDSTKLKIFKAEMEARFPNYFFELIPITEKGIGRWTAFTNIFRDMNYVADRSYNLVPIRATNFVGQFERKNGGKASIYFDMDTQAYKNNLNRKISEEWIKQELTEQAYKQFLSVVGG